MRLPPYVSLTLILIAGLTAFGQESPTPSNELLSPSLELTLIKSPEWMGSCLELSLQRTNVSKSSIFLNGMFEGVKVYSSVRETSNTTIAQGPTIAWMLVYGWTDLVLKPIEFRPGQKKQSALCIDGTFPVKQTGKETLRQIRVQGKLRVVAEYQTPAWKTVDRPQGDGKRSYVRTVDKLAHRTFNRVVLEISIPCHSGADAPDCSSPAEILPGEHDVHTVEIRTIEPEAPPNIQLSPPQPATIPIDSPTPPRPQARIQVTP